MRFFVIFLVIVDFQSHIYGYMSTVATGVTRKTFKPLGLASIEDHLNSVEEISLGAPYSRPSNGAYISAGGIKVDVEVEEVLDSPQEVSNLVDMLNDHKGLKNDVLILNRSVSFIILILY